MARYVYGWVECKTLFPELDESEWKPVVDLHYLLQEIKDADGFEILFGKENVANYQGIQASATHITASFGAQAEQSLHYHPLVHLRGLPGDISAFVQSEYARFDRGMEQMPMCDIITSSPTEWVAWREVNQGDWEKMDKPIDGPLPEIYQNEQGEQIFRFWIKRISRPPVSWVSWQELKLVDWEEEIEFIDKNIYEFQRDELGKVSLRTDSASLWEFRKRTGCKQIDFSQEQVWDLGNIIYQVKKTKKRRRDVLKNWESALKVSEILAEKYGDEGIRIIAWLA